jgi:hypothetical protein
MCIYVKKSAIIISFIIVIGGFLTFLMTWRNIGFSNHFIGAWLSSFALCVLCIAPIGGVISIVTNSLVNKVFYTLSMTQKNIVFGFIMAVVMESIMAIVTTINLHGFLILSEFIALWGTTFISALPAGLVISILMSLVIKPKLAVFWAKA